MFNPSSLNKLSFTVSPEPVSNVVSDFVVVGELTRSNSGKTVKIYVFENGRRYFVGQVTYGSLRGLLDGSSLKVDINKYQNTSKGETRDATTR
ncbi:MAG: hypothetical protein FWG55_04785 [Candidatus Bathyarchaeota archaeon]|nr:hypothetical protein [Candidatus Termiticorpusculum sp.]